MSKSENKNNFDLDRALCDWCINPLTLSGSFENRVCQDCYLQLIRIGLSDEQIFSHKNFFPKSAAL